MPPDAPVVTKCAKNRQLEIQFTSTFQPCWWFSSGTVFSAHQMARQVQNTVPREDHQRRSEQ